MDLLRGIAIVLVVVFHATTIAARYEMLPPLWLQTALDSLAPFRMPLLMFLSGMLLPRSLAKAPVPYFTGKARSILWPYLLWSLVFLMVSNDVSGKRLLQVIVMPPTYLWFLWFLFAYYALAWVAFKWRIGPYILLGAALIGMFGPEVYRFARFWYLMVFFLAGALMVTGITRLSGSGRWTVVCAVPLLALGAVGGVLSASGSEVQYAPLLIPLALSGVVAAVILAARLPRRWIPEIIVGIGASSLVFYVTHFAVMWLVVAALAESGLATPLITIVVAFAAALVVGFGFIGLRRFRVIDLLFTFPARVPLPGRSSGASR